MESPVLPGGCSSIYLPPLQYHKEESMRKNQALKFSHSAVLRPLSQPKKETCFRKMVKNRNQALGSGLMTPTMRYPQLNTVRHSQHASTTAINRFSEACYPLKEFVKDRITKKVPDTKISAHSSRKHIKADTCNESRISSYSRAELRSSSATRFQGRGNSYSRLQGSLLAEARNSGCSIEELRKKVAHLLDLNIQRCRLMEGKGEVSSWVDQKKAQEVESELLQIEEILRNPQEEEQRLPEVLSKIELLEQTLAGQLIESDSLKKCYFNQRNQYFNTTSYQNKSKLKESLVLNTKLDPKLVIKASPREYLQKCASSSKEFYQKPKREFYVPPVKIVKKYEHNRIKMPATSYATQFTSKHGAMLPSQEPFRKALPKSSLCVKTSTYQNEFSSKLDEVKTIDYRELDCAKNKLRNIDISFTESSQKPQMSQVSKSYKVRVAEKENYSTLKGFEMKSGMFSMDSFYETEQSKHFGEKEATSMLKSSPKNKVLLQLKENYRRLAQAI